MKDKKQIYILGIILFLIDQILKRLVCSFMILYEEKEIIPNFFSLLYVKNTGAAFSIFENNTFFLIIISILFMIGVIFYIKRENYYTFLAKVSLGFLLGGIWGNLFDRIFYHGVIDYLSFRIFHYDFPIFNFADILITTGIILFMLDTFFPKTKDKKVIKDESL